MLLIQHKNLHNQNMLFTKQEKILYNRQFSIYVKAPPLSVHLFVICIYIFSKILLQLEATIA